MALAVRMGITPKDLWGIDPEQLDLLIAWTEVEKDIGPHGQFMSEATSPDADPMNYDTQHPIRYAVHPIIDQVQAAIKRTRKALETEHPDEDFSDRVWAVEKL